MHFCVVRRSEEPATLQLLLHCVKHFIVAVSKHERTVCEAEINELTPVNIVNARAFRMRREERKRLERPHRTAHASSSFWSSFLTLFRFQKEKLFLKGNSDAWHKHLKIEKEEKSEKLKISSKLNFQTGEVIE